MCIFCAAIPVAASVGVSVSAKQARKRHETSGPAQMSARRPVSAGKATAVVVAMLVAGSAVTHLVIGPRTGIYW